jgi:hypothetical protein
VSGVRRGRRISLQTQHCFIFSPKLSTGVAELGFTAALGLRLERAMAMLESRAVSLSLLKGSLTVL